MAAAWGFYYYLSTLCGCHISWAGDQVHLPASLPSLPPGGVNVTSNDRYDTVIYCIVYHLFDLKIAQMAHILDMDILVWVSGQVTLVFGHNSSTVN